jgi:Predicted glycosyltransferases
MDVPDLSIIIVSYRVREVLRGCLRSLYQEGGLRGLTTPEVIVVDNASGDGTPEMVRADFPQVRLLALPENRGFSAGNNAGLDLATGRNVLLLNPDTLVPDGALAACVAFLDAQPEDVGAMTCRVESTDGSLQWECSRRLITPWSECCRALLLDRVFKRSDLFNREPVVGWDRADTRKVECLLGAFMLIRRRALEAVGGLDEQFFLMYEDVDWCKRLRDAGFRAVFWPGARITHLGGQSWRQDPIATYANTHASAVLYFRKHHPRAVGTVRLVSRLGMEVKILLLRLNLLRKPGDDYTVRHLAMARAARASLRTGAFLLRHE